MALWKRELAKEEGKGIWEQKRPSWCPHASCCFLRRVQDGACGGELPVPEPHHHDLNTHRLCIRFEDDGNVVDMQVNTSDLDWLRWVFDALDGKKTSWLSQPPPERSRE